jgi:hypothetical protein
MATSDLVTAVLRDWTGEPRMQAAFARLLLDLFRLLPPEDYNTEFVDHATVRGESVPQLLRMATEAGAEPWVVPLVQAVFLLLLRYDFRTLRMVMVPDHPVHRLLGTRPPGRGRLYRFREEVLVREVTKFLETPADEQDWAAWVRLCRERWMGRLG